MDLGFVLEVESGDDVCRKKTCVRTPEVGGDTAAGTVRSFSLSLCMH